MKDCLSEKTIIVWGCGYIGFSDLCFFGNAGQKCIGVDIDPFLQQKIIEGSHKPDLVKWLQMDYKHLFFDGTIRIVTDTKEFPTNQLTHLICVPTEKNGTPFLDTLYQVIDSIIKIEKKRKTPAISVVIESTTVPGTAKKCYTKFEQSFPDKEILFSTSPRRDWFLEPSKNLANLPRIIGSNSPSAEKYHTELLGIACKELIVASNYEVSELTKSVENAIRHVGITLANQLTDAYPNVNMREVLALAGTKWNINTYYPSFGTGGYCIPLSSQYLLVGANEVNNVDIPILNKTVQYDSFRKNHIAEDILSDKFGGNVLFFGVAYKAETTVLKNSAALPMIQNLCNRGFQVFVVDPLLNEIEIQQATGCKAMEAGDVTKEFLSNVDAIVYFTAHSAYHTELMRISKEISPECQIYDGTEAQNIVWPEKQYHLIGTPSWHKKV